MKTPELRPKHGGRREGAGRPEGARDRFARRVLRGSSRPRFLGLGLGAPDVPPADAVDRILRGVDEGILSSIEAKNLIDALRSALKVRDLPRLQAEVEELRAKVEAK